MTSYTISALVAYPLLRSGHIYAEIYIKLRRFHKLLSNIVFSLM